ncbi:glycosyltransferase family 39 protein [Flagellimonas hymeniacidonis]|uniref:Glycosyltransferase family 39 protein n=1 Tax=Flagellimonas hymeniacidonis TaxID=2603628 RepID=A0A5C8V8Q2_9FLAO|nr:glycosyltransferase family 39 protein [Flagellimonas hymeniacidonis]TXN38077.1 glycosyltransferase family 39 protein [Flagellimonas hymeniacidonis]
MAQKFPRLFLVLLGILFILNLVQSYFTELIYDEAYYWYYAQHLDWGYFDHPPMVAFLIKLSSFFFSGELGVRFMSCLLSVGTYLILWLLIDHPRKKEYVVHFFLLVFSMTLVNAYGFLTLPDTPLLFFTALFLLLYKNFLNRSNILIIICLGVVMAALMYSKYHAVLVILFVFLSNLNLIKNPKAWLAVAIALVCYSPHFLWLYQNDFVSIKYHLYERPNQAYSFEKFTLGYVINLVAIFGLLFYWVYLSLIKTKATDRFTKALVYLTYGVLIFFFVSSFNRRVQTQWIIVISIPMAVLAFNHLLQNAQSRKWMYRLGWVSLVILLYARLWLVHQPLLPLLFETHGNKQWVAELNSKAGDTPIVFENSYRRSPMYEFYSGIPTFSLNNHMYRKNQYSIDNSEERVRGKKVLYVSKYRSSGDIQYTYPDSTVFYGIFMDNFQSYRNLQCIVEQPQEGTKRLLKVYNPYEFDIPIDALSYTVAYSNKYKQVKELVDLKVEAEDLYQVLLKSKDTVFYHFQLPLPQMERPGYFRIGISENGLLPGLNGKPIKLTE